MLEADFNNYSELKAPIFIDPVMQKSIDLIIQLNTYLFGLSGALFAVLGILEKSKQKSTIHIYLVVFSCVMICMSFFYGYKSLYEILNQVSQYQIALKPRQSVSIMYLAWEFYHFFAAVVAAGVAYIIRNPESANE
ncbi:MAG: hypothetical protein IPM97_01340 [Bdellovibrionaceae bacterium]|nr:hypothetical protein [Pseudobdellovibrionaceae bacterium]